MFFEKFFIGPADLKIFVFKQRIVMANHKLIRGFLQETFEGQPCPSTAILKVYVAKVQLISRPGYLTNILTGTIRLLRGSYLSDH